MIVSVFEVDYINLVELYDFNTLPMKSGPPGRSPVEQTYQNLIITE